MKSKLLSSSSNIDCESCQAKLADYVRLELTSQNADQTYPEIAFHVETCEKCEAAYYQEFQAQGQQKSLAELQQIGQRPLLAQVMQQIVPPVGPEPAPDPRWHEVALAQGRAWVEQETGRWRQLMLSLVPLSEASRGTPALAGLMSAAPSASPVLGAIEITSPDDNIEIKLTVVANPNAADEELCQVEVAISLNDRFGDFSGISVTLWWGDSVQTKETDALGKVSFMRLPRQQLPSMNLWLALG